MAVTFKDGVILGADSRTTTGSAADTQAIADIVKYYLQLHAAQLPPNEKPSTEIAANVFQELCYNNKDALTAGIICAGYDKKNKGSVYSIPIGGSIHQQDYAIAGSGSTFIYARSISCVPGKPLP
ncbi:Proteasome subunit beta type-1 [Cerrena zonata]|uniref:Proteasome subunit beta type-1 n=1 Tax=Cerrena zonata TaxID=2478898 RepID=A0AAW0FNB1_9APHY